MERQTLMSIHILVMELVLVKKKYTHSHGKDCYDLVIFGVGMSVQNMPKTENIVFLY